MASSEEFQRTLEELRDAGDAEAAFWLEVDAEEGDPTSEGATQERLGRARRSAGPTG